MQPGRNGIRSKKKMKLKQQIKPRGAKLPLKI
jgi:hypothetical protein